MATEPKTGGPEVLAEFVTTTDELLEVLQGLKGERAAVAVGEFKAAAFQVERRDMTADQRAGWYDRHVDESALSVIVLRETSWRRREPRPVSASQLRRVLHGRSALLDVATERQRQVEAKGYSRAHDDEHEPGELAHAAACYALSGARATTIVRLALTEIWPWDRAAWRPKTPRQDLVRAAALLLAEIERMDRAEASR